MKTEKGLKSEFDYKNHFQKLKAKSQFHMHMRSIHVVTEMENRNIVFNKTKGTLFHKRGFEISLFSVSCLVWGAGLGSRTP